MTKDTLKSPKVGAELKSKDDNFLPSNTECSVQQGVVERSGEVQQKQMQLVGDISIEEPKQGLIGPKIRRTKK